MGRGGKRKGREGGREKWEGKRMTAAAFRQIKNLQLHNCLKYKQYLADRANGRAYATVLLASFESMCLTV